MPCTKELACILQKCRYHGRQRKAGKLFQINQRDVTTMQCVILDQTTDKILINYTLDNNNENVKFPERLKKKTPKPEFNQ